MLLGLVMLVPALPPLELPLLAMGQRRPRTRLPLLSDADYQRVEEMLDQLAEKMREAKPTASADEKAIRKKIPEGAAIVDFMEYEGLGKERGLRLMALVRTSRRLERVELGLVAPLRAAMESYTASLVADPPGKIDEEAGKKLRKLLWQPVAEFVAGIENLWIVPDGCVYEVPFAALPGEKAGTWLVEEHCLELLRSPAHLLEAKPKAMEGEPLLVDGTKIADKAALKRELAKRKPRLLHLSGLGLNGKGPRAAAMLLGSEAKSMLTALEAAELPLAGCPLVVLTGHGTARTAYARGEGGLGMPRAFGLAGARHVVAALWNTSDEATARLMSRFKTELKEKPPAQALRAAQVWMLKKPGSKVMEWAGFMAYSQGG